MPKRAFKLLFLILLCSGNIIKPCECMAVGPNPVKDIKYPVSSISPELLENSDMVVRAYDMNIEVKSINSYTLKIHRVCTILRESKLKDAMLAVFYNDFSKITSIKSTIYSANGYEIRKLKASEIKDESAIDDGIMYSDDRVKWVLPGSVAIPYTIEFNYEVEYDHILSFPKFQPMREYRVSLERADFCLTADNELVPRFKEMNIPQPASITNNSDKKVVSYHFQNLKAVEDEAFSIALADRVPSVHIAPNDVKSQGNTYSFRSWQSYGQWDYDLNKDRDQLPERTKKTVSDLLKDKITRLDKIKCVYHFVQENTRYVAVELGIGGFQTAEANEVAEKSFGDCKGLVNYTKAILSLAGINSYAVLVNSGREEHDIYPDFPSNQFDHVILCIPGIENDRDTIWLECTSQRQPFGFLGSFTDNRHAIIVTPQGGVLTKTPSYPGQVSTRNRNVSIKLDSAGNANIDLTTKYKGLQSELVAGMEHLSAEDQKKALLASFQSSTTKIDRLNFSFTKEVIPETTELLDISMRSFASPTGNRLFVPFNFSGPVDANPNELAQRTSPLYFRHSYTRTDTIEVIIPQGYNVETVPQSVDLSNQFGHFMIKVEQSGGKLVYIRIHKVNEGIFEPESLKDYSKYQQEIAKADKRIAVLIKH